MMQPQILRPSWQLSPSFTDSASDGFERSFTEIISPFHHLSTDFSESVPSDDYPIEDLLMDADFELESLFHFEISSPDCAVSAVAEENTSELSPGQVQWSPSSSLRSESAVLDSSSATQQAMDFMEVDNKLSLHHLMKAYGEAMENDQVELMEVIRRCAAERADPFGESVERLAFYLFCRDQEADYEFLAEESRKNFEAAFDAFYQIFMTGRFSHFAANRAILESIPPQIEVLRVVDFEIGDGIQWAPVIDAIAGSHSSRITLKITSIKSEDKEESPQNTIDRHYRLQQHATVLGVDLTVDEMKIDELFHQTRCNPREWTAFNCMVGLPHMAGGKRRRSRCDVEKFLAVAQQITSINGGGIIAFADGDEARKTNAFGEFFEGCVKHYQKILEVMDAELPSELAEARLAMESLFVSPSVCSSDWLTKWEEIKACLNGGGVDGECGRRTISRENVMEAMELVKGKSWYGVKIAEKENEMVLEWRDSPLVRLSIWGK